MHKHTAHVLTAPTRMSPATANVLHRDGGQLVPPTDLHATQLLLREAQYYQLTGLIQQLQQHEAQLQQEKTAQQQVRGAWTGLGVCLA